MTEETPRNDTLPLLPLKDVVVFPRMVVPLMVGRPASLAAVEASLATSKPLFLCAQRDADVEEPQRDDLYGVGVAANILQTLRMPDGTMKVVVEGLARAQLDSVGESGSHMEADVNRVDELDIDDSEGEALMRLTLGQFEDYARANQRVAPEIVASLSDVQESSALADLICSYLPLRVEERQELLEIPESRERLQQLSTKLMRETELMDIERQVRDRVREQMDRNQREYYLQEQLKAIRQELGHREDSDEHEELQALIEKSRMPRDIREKAEKELTRYSRMPSMTPEAGVIRTYLEWLVEMPWKNRTRDALDLTTAKQILDEDHFGLAKVKERILEFLAVRKLRKNTRGPILCLVGPPGVGKTSLGQSIARAMGRKFVRFSLGGVRDEAEIRGHRRTYIGALPGRIVQNLKRAGVRNPVFMLDELDKMSVDFRGDPSSALLEVLDPEQNKAFNDHYLEVDVDLTDVFFIATANYEYDIPEALYDRLEIVRLPGYTGLEKQQIAKRFLIPKQVQQCGLREGDIHFAESGIKAIINKYTREAGVRELERQIANVCRKVARHVVVKGRGRRTAINEKRALDMLGTDHYLDTLADAKPQVGVSVGLAWTSTGGDILNIECTTMPGKGGLQLTGQLGEVMQESAQAAYTYLRAHARELRIPAGFHKNSDIHIHVPEGAIPKDGPSAGVAIAVAMVSALRERPPRAALAMTGELTLRGRVLAIGGVKEKVLAAHRAGITTILLPKENEKDMVEIPPEVRRDISFHIVDDVKEVFKHAFGRPRKK
jgi:ATP-dependent Lon protease